MMEMLISNLHAFRELRVLPSITSLAYQDSKKDIQTIGQETHVSNVVGGSLWKTNGNLHVSIQLSSVESGSLVWTQSFEKPLEDPRHRWLFWEAFPFCSCTLGHQPLARIRSCETALAGPRQPTLHT